MVTRELLTKIDTMLSDPEYSDELRPLPEDVDACKRLLVSVEDILYRKSMPMPRGCVTTDGEGSRIRIEWRGENGSVFLVFPEYVYSSINSEGVVSKYANIKNLYSELSRLVQPRGGE